MSVKKSFIYQAYPTYLERTYLTPWRFIHEIHNVLTFRLFGTNWIVWHFIHAFCTVLSNLESWIIFYWWYWIINYAIVLCQFLFTLPYSYNCSEFPFCVKFYSFELDCLIKAPCFDTLRIDKRMLLTNTNSLVSFVSLYDVYIIT